MKTLQIHNGDTINIRDIPVLSYDIFMDTNISLATQAHCHCVIYFAYPTNAGLHFICCMADDTDKTIHISSFTLDNPDTKIDSLTASHMSFHVFERDIHERYGVQFINHPWLKPVRYPTVRHNRQSSMQQYPFYHSTSEELHEVGVGPVHAGIIEPGHFRFICNGEQILHLEIQLGYQHRGIEELFIKKTGILQRSALAESIAGDTVVGHSWAFTGLMESLSAYSTSEQLQYERTVALEIERIAVHTGDMAAICTDVAYQLGNAVLGRLRTPIINFFQRWCGNRLAKSLIRPYGCLYPFSPALAERCLIVLDSYERDFDEIWQRINSLPSFLSRVEQCGVLTAQQILDIGAVGMTARMAGVKRDIRASHPYGQYNSVIHLPVLMQSGDVYARTALRQKEIKQSLAYLQEWLQKMPDTAHTSSVPLEKKLKPSSFSLFMTEGWRGEICHAAITDSEGNILSYRIKDPSMHNWTALALAVRNNEISDFPINNKSFNLSYCGFDL